MKPPTAVGTHDGSILTPARKYDAGFSVKPPPIIIAQNNYANSIGSQDSVIGRVQ